jgi:ParB family chromosome partitioning protein
MTTTEGKKTNGSKRGFAEATYTSAPQFDPLDLVLIGGKALEGDERGPHDTDDGKEHPLWDRRTLEPLEEPFIANIDAYGVHTSIIVTKMDGKPTVIAGRQRVRAARVVNARRKKRGEAPIKVTATTRASSDATDERIATTLLGPMTSENEGRRNDGILGKIEKLHRLKERGVSDADAAITFCVSPKTIAAWLAYDEGATKEMKRAVEAGKITISAATDIVRKLGEPEKQNAALEEVLAAVPSGARPSRREAKAAAKKATKGSEANVGVTEKRVQKKLLAYLKDLPHSNASVSTLSWWSGAEAMLELILGEDDADKKIVEALEKSREWEPKKTTEK